MLARRRVLLGQADDSFFNGISNSVDDNLDAFPYNRDMESRIRPSSAKECNSSSGRDRTIEFLSVIKSANARNPNYKSVSSQNQNKRLTEFQVISSKIGKDVSSTNEKLESLKLIYNRQDGEGKEMANQLSEIIRQDLTMFSKQVAQLQQFLKHQVFNKQRMAHSNSVIVALQSKLVKMSANFKAILELEQQKVNISTKTSNSRVIQGHQTNDLKEACNSPYNNVANQNNSPPYGYQGHKRPNAFYPSPAQQSATNTSGAMDCHGEQSSNVRNDYLSYQPQKALRQRYVQEDRSKDEMVKIEQTIVELGGIFQQLTNMVHEQGEMINRIDSHIDDASLNVDLAHTELVKYFRSVASMRGLMLKVFAILIVFIVFFFFFYL